MPTPPTVKISDRLATTPSRNRTFCLPDLVSDLVDDLVDRTAAVGYSTKRAEVVAALIVAARTLPPDELEERVREYLTLDVGSIAGDRQRDGMVDLRPPAPGPRPNSR